jgi:NitT/TauT family transport system ATP-binding protein
MIEEIAAPPYNGQADLPHLADSLQLEIDELFPLGETLQLLKFVEFADADIKLTPLGRRFADMDVDQRKKVMGEQLIANIPLAAHIKRVIDERPSHRAPATRFREELEDFMSEDYAERTLRAIITLGRYGELFAYDEDAQAFSYENPT